MKKRKDKKEKNDLLRYGPRAAHFLDLNRRHLDGLVKLLGHDRAFKLLIHIGKTVDEVL